MCSTVSRGCCPASAEPAFCLASRPERSRPQRIKLGRANLNRFFPFGGYGSDSADRGELTRKAIDRASGILGSRLDSQRVLVLGDTPKDIAAHAAGAIGVASPWQLQRRRAAQLRRRLRACLPHEELQASRKLGRLTRKALTLENHHSSTELRAATPGFGEWRVDLSTCRGKACSVLIRASRCAS